jgi:hypothetical protein
MTYPANVVLLAGLVLAVMMALPAGVSRPRPR